jgi:hypothetical protein
MTDVGRVGPGQNNQATQKDQKPVDIPVFLKPFMMPATLKEQPQQDELVLSQGQKKNKPSMFSFFKDLYNIVVHPDRIVETARKQNEQNYEQLKKELGIPD